MFFVCFAVSFVVDLVHRFCFLTSMFKAEFITCGKEVNLTQIGGVVITREVLICCMY